VTIVSEVELRAQLGPPRHGATVEVPPGARLTPAAADLVRAWSLEVREVPGALSDGRGPGAPPRSGRAPVGHDHADGAGNAAAAWDVPGRFPVVLEGELPVCVTCGTEVRRKPSHLTQLDARFFAPKTDARVRLRGRLDTLQAFALLTAARARADGWPDLAGDLDTVAAYCRELLAAEYHLRAPGALRVAGLDEATLHHASHHPEEAVGLPHLVPDASHPEILHWLNLLRCQVREAEMTALDAFPPEHHPGTEGGALARAVNRLSSAIYYLELRTAAACTDGTP
jgi:ethanolamine utilization cobalamin adenosyltransferase